MIGVLTVAALAAIPGVSAQEAVCPQEDPCPWIIDIGPGGFIETDPQWNFTTGDWVQVDLFNFDEDAAHTVRFAGHVWQVGPLGSVFTDALQVPAEGDHPITDEPSGDVRTVLVLPTTTADEAGEATRAADPFGQRDTPTAGFAAFVLLLVASASRGRV